MKNIFLHCYYSILFISTVFSILAAPAYARTISNEEYLQQLSVLYQDTSPAGLSNTFAWFLKAAHGGHLDAQTEVGCRYKFGISVDQNYPQALFWLQKAAENGSPKAAHYLGVMHALGEGVPQDEPRAIEYYYQAATQNFALSQISLANRYRDGLGVTQDYHKAIYWFYQAASQDFANAWTMIGHMFEMGNGVPRSRLVAYDYYRRGADAGDGSAQVNLGLAYFRGRDVPRDYALARKWLLMAAEQENAYAQYILGIMHEEGRGYDRSDEQAVIWYERSGSNGISFASFMAGMKYFIGDGIPPDQQKSLAAFTRITENETEDLRLLYFSWFMISAIHLREGNMDEAKAALLHALSFKPFLLIFIAVIVILLVVIALLIAIIIVIGISHHAALTTWGVLDAVVVFALLLLSFFAGNFLTLFNLSSKTLLTWAICITVGLNLIVLAVPVGLAIKRRWNLKLCFSCLPVKFRTLLAWSLVSLACIFLFSFLYKYSLSRLGITVPRQWLQDQVLSLTSTFELQIFIFTGGILIPILEELIFRGIIYNGLRSKLPTMFAVSITSVLFAVVHIEPWSILPIFFMSTILCYSLEKTKSIAVPIVIHCLNNLIAISLLLLEY